MNTTIGILNTSMFDKLYTFEILDVKITFHTCCKLWTVYG